MGTATAATVVSGIIRRLHSGAYLRGLPSKLMKDLEHVKIHLCVLHLLLTRATVDQYFEMSAQTRKIKQVVYDLEDLVAELEYHSSIKHRPSGRTWKEILFLLSSPLLLHTTMAIRLNTMSRKLEDSVTFSVRRRASSNREQYKEQLGFDGAAIIGRDSEKQHIKELLLQNSADKLSILRIAGLPGLGKTTLARLVFEDEGEAWDFDLRIWICLEKNFDLEKIAMGIVSEAKKSLEGRISLASSYNQGMDNFYLISHDVQTVLHNSSCLIVLDNLLCRDYNGLNNLKAMLGAKPKCTKVIVTTCSEIVAESVPSYKLDCLSEDDCWAIFSEKAFGNRDAIADSQYTEIGKKIVKRCNGIPILARSLGSMVCNQGMNTWLAARDDEMWKLEDRLSPKAKVFSSFKEIYYSMPQLLKSCFLYLSVFPRGSNIDKDELIRQWIALDLISPKYGVLPLFELGERYIRDLLSISFLQVAGTPSVTEMKCINAPPVVLHMHNFVYDFLRYAARDDLIILDYGKALSGCIEKLPLRYAVLTNYNGESRMHKDLITGAKAVFFKKCESTMPIEDTFSVLRYSRVLDLSGCPFEELPASIGQLKHLRYLNISDSRIRALPKKMSHLQNLEFLDVSNTCIEVLHPFVGTFQKLKYFNLHGCDRLRKLPPILGGLKKLEHLNLSCCSGIGELPVSLCGLNELRLLDLSSCTRLEQLPHPFGNLGTLGDLNLAGCSRLQQLPESFGSLSSLKFLNIADCSRLQQLPESIAGLSSLMYLNVSNVRLELPDSLSSRGPHTGPHRFRSVEIIGHESMLCNLE